MSRFGAVCGGLFVALSMQAGTIIYDSTSQTPNGADPVATTGPLYDSFSTGLTAGNLVGLEFLLNGDNTSEASFSVDLFADSGSTTVGLLIQNLGTIQDSSLSATDSIIDVSLVANPLLNAGTRYWIGLTGAETTASWSWTEDTSGIGVNGEFFQNSHGTFPNNPEGGYQMQVQISDVSTPEPATLLLVTAALAALALLHRRRATN
jgi:hypothetical protein